MRLELREVQKAFDQKQVLKGASFVKISTGRFWT